MGGQTNSISGFNAKTFEVMINKVNKDFKIFCIDRNTGAPKLQENIIINLDLELRLKEEIKKFNQDYDGDLSYLKELRVALDALKETVSKARKDYNDDKYYFVQNTILYALFPEMWAGKNYTTEKNYTMEERIREGKEHIEAYLKSNPDLLCKRQGESDKQKLAIITLHLAEEKADLRRVTQASIQDAVNILKVVTNEKLDLLLDNIMSCSITKSSLYHPYEPYDKKVFKKTPDAKARFKEDFKAKLQVLVTAQEQAHPIMQQVPEQPEPGPMQELVQDPALPHENAAGIFQWIMIFVKKICELFGIMFDNVRRYCGMGNNNQDQKHQL